MKEKIYSRIQATSWRIEDEEKELIRNRDALRNIVSSENMHDVGMWAKCYADRIDESYKKLRALHNLKNDLEYCLKADE